MIGGEFPIAVTDILNASIKHSATPDVYTYSSGRAALYQILNHLKEQNKVTHVLLPDHLCSTILVPIHKLGLSYSFFPLNEKLELESDSFWQAYRKNAAVLLINYFGLQDLTSQISSIRTVDEKALIIEDDVQAYYEFCKPLGDVDFKYTSLRKTFAVPDGGLVKTYYTLPRDCQPNTFGQYKAAAGVMKSLREGFFDDNVYLDISHQGAELIDKELEMGMSLVSQKLYAITDIENVKQKRIDNARYLIKKLDDIGIKPLLPLLEEKVPLFVPIILSNRDEVRRKMFDNEIFCPVHWPHEGMSVKKGNEMAEHELSLIVDQRYSKKDMDLILSLIQ